MITFRMDQYIKEEVRRKRRAPPHYPADQKKKWKLVPIVLWNFLEDIYTKKKNWTLLGKLLNYVNSYWI